MQEKSPHFGKNVYVAEGARVIGDVTLGDNVSIWPCAVLRGDEDSIEVLDNSNVQDGSVLHADFGYPVRVGKRVTIGHAAIVHGASVGDDVLIGMGSIVLTGASVGSGSIVAAGALIPEGMRVEPGSVVMGIPARVVRKATEEDAKRIRESYEAYLKLVSFHVKKRRRTQLPRRYFHTAV
ncbi:gamma carbonic anhydrase family protein [Tardisphaera saccharovorans]